MKTIVIIEDETREQDALATLFNQWQKKLNILTATDEQAAIAILSKQQVDLLICDLSTSGTSRLVDFSLLTQSFPYIPCIALSKKHGPQPKKVLDYGASHCFVKPLDTKQLLDCAYGILENSPTGATKGIPVHSFLQMLESEEQTCILEVISHTDRGLLYIKKGELLGAETKAGTGEDAAQEILSWPDPSLRLLYFNGQYNRQITRDLLSIIMDSFELSSGLNKKQASGKIRTTNLLPLQHSSTQGKELPLKLGARIKIAFSGEEAELDSSLVGIVKDNCIIVQNPLPDSDVQQQLNSERLMVKYMYNEKMWMFKSQLVHATKTPAALLFLEYPKIIHYHELRKAKRSTIFVPSTFHLQGEKELYGVLIDMSLTGSLCQIKHKNQAHIPVMGINSTVVLRCLLPGIPEEQQLYGKVKNMKIEDGETRIGIEFDGLQPQLTDTIGKYLYSLNKESG